MEMEQVRKSFSVKLVVFTVLFFAMGHTASAGTLRKPPNNLGLVAYWPFNERGGTEAGDASGNSHEGTLSGTTALPTWSSGKLGGGLSLDVNNNNRVTFTPITTGTTNTISAWIYLTSDCGSYGSIFSQDGVEGLYCYQNGGGNNKLDFWYEGTPTDHFSNTPLALNRWYHVAIVNAVGSATFYLNGVADGTIASVPSFNANTMGGDTLTETLPGKLDEVRLYGRALSASDVYALYKSGAVQVNNSYKSPGTLSAGLTSHYTFDGKDMINKVDNIATTGKKGTLAGFTSTTTVPGKVGQALTFDGVNDYVNTNTAVTSFMSSATGTISVWLRPTGDVISRTSAQMYSTQHAVSSSGLFGSFGISRANLTNLGQDKIWAWAYASSVGYVVGVPYVVGEWIHVTWVHANGLLSAYKNGDFVGSVAFGTLSNFTGNLYIGSSWSGSPGWWSGDIDELRTYNRDLSAAEIKQLYNLTLGTKVNKPSVNSLTSGLVGYYTFDGGDTDWSANTTVNRGSLGGAATLTSMSITTSPTPGKVGQGLKFVSGVSSVVNLGSSSSLMPGTGSFSASIWVKRDNSSGLNAFIGGRATVFQPWWEIREAGVQVSDGSQVIDKSFTLPNDNAWHHVVMVLNRTPSPDTLEIYIDGISQGPATGTLDGHNVSGTGSIYIGRGSWTSPTLFQGALDEARIYNRAISTAEVLQLYRMGK